jgi:hypothetical protein
LYTVLNIPEEFIGEAYDLKKSDIDRISEGYIREYTSKLSGFLNQKDFLNYTHFMNLKK